MKGYWIVRLDVLNAEKYASYLSTNAEKFKEFGGRFLVRAGRFENPEGTSRARNIIVEFPSYEAAMACWQSPEYQRGIPVREPVSTMDLVIIEGYDGPQP